MTRRELVRAVRSVLLAALSLDNDQVVSEHFAGTHAEPRIQVRATVHDIPYGSDETTGDIAIQGERLATITLVGFGEDASDWLGTFALILPRPDVQALLAAQGITLRTLGGERDLSRPRAEQAGGWAVQVVREFEAGWVRSSDPATTEEVSEVEVTLTYPREPGETAPPALSDTVTVRPE